MTGLARDSQFPGARAPGSWQRPGPGYLVAGAGAVGTLVSLFLPWYELRLRVAGSARSSGFATAHARSLHAVCSPPSGSCSVSASVGLLAAGIWDWRVLIAAGAAVTLVVVVVGAMLPGRLWQGSRTWQVLTVVASTTAVLVLAGVAMNPLSTAGTSWPGLSVSLSYGAAAGVAGAAAAIAGGLLLHRDPDGETAAEPSGRLSPWSTDG